MKNHFAQLWLLFATAFAVIVIVALCGAPTIAGYTLKTAPIDEFLRHPEPSKPAQVIAAVPKPVVHTVKSVEAPPKRTPVDTTAQTILFIGDSMLEGLSPRLAAYAEHNGHTLYTVIWYSSSTEVWGNSDKLAKYIADIKPDYIFVCLGANELAIRDIAAKRTERVKKILADIDTIPYLWIGPPNWRKDTGINDLIAAHAAEGCFFRSDGMSFERKNDGAHPTRSSAALWMDSVVRWMPDNARHRIRLDKPEKTSARPKRTYMHKPNE